MFSSSYVSIHNCASTFLVCFNYFPNMLKFVKIILKVKIITNFALVKLHVFMDFSYDASFFLQISAPPKVANLKIIGDLRENSKVTVTGIVTGGNEASSRVQWFKTYSSTFDGESSLEALSTSKIAKVGILLGFILRYNDS